MKLLTGGEKGSIRDKVRECVVKEGSGPALYFEGRETGSRLSGPQGDVSHGKRGSLTLEQGGSSHLEKTQRSIRQGNPLEKGKLVSKEGGMAENRLAEKWRGGTYVGKEAPFPEREARPRGEPGTTHNRHWGTQKGIFLVAGKRGMYYPQVREKTERKADGKVAVVLG